MIREVSRRIAQVVALAAMEEGHADVREPAEVERAVVETMWTPTTR